VNVRLRVKLMDALLAQDIGFFDVTRTGDITSRLSSDTTLVGDQVTLNVNVFLRSLVQAIGVLAFMFVVSWQLSMLAFISVPIITVLSKSYGNFIRHLTKLMQKKVCFIDVEYIYSWIRSNKAIQLCVCSWRMAILSARLPLVQCLLFVRLTRANPSCTSSRHACSRIYL
jgi:ABC-type multidrug transport system fused ATPase/permease subunit